MVLLKTLFFDFGLLYGFLVLLRLNKRPFSTDLMILDRSVAAKWLITSWIEHGQKLDKDKVMDSCGYGPWIWTTWA